MSHISCRKTQFSIEFIIVGADVAGLATAFRLRQSGHRVIVIDKGTGVTERKGGVHLTPNGTKLLREWGFAKQLKRYGVSARIMENRSMDDGQFIGILPWQEDVLQESGDDYILIPVSLLPFDPCTACSVHPQYCDLYQTLLDAARSVGVNVIFQITVTSVQPDPRRPCIVLSNGRTMSAHVIIGADGPCSVVRQVINGPVQHKFEGHSQYVAAISREQLKDDPELYELVSYNPETPIYILWRSYNCHCLLLTNQSKECFLHLCLPEIEAEGHANDDLAFDGVMVAGNRLKFQCEPRLKRLINRVPTFLRKRLYLCDFAKDWTDAHGRLVLMSEAAYPIWPFCIQTCSIRIEDAAVLTTLFTHLKSEEQIPFLCRAFQEIREPRVYTLRAKETKALGHWWLPPGSEKASIDEALRLMALQGHKGWDEDKLLWQWNEICDVFTYHGREAAEDWWVVWGVLRERSRVVNEGPPLG